MVVVNRSARTVLINSGPIMHEFEVHMHGERNEILPNSYNWGRGTGSFPPLSNDQPLRDP